MSVKTNSSFHTQPQDQVKEENKSQRQNSVVHFANDIPLVVVEIPLNGKIAKLPIFEFSSPDNLAAQFCRKYQLDEKVKKPIRKMIEQEMQQALNAKQQQSFSENAPNIQNTRQLIKSQSTAQISQSQYPQQQLQQQPQFNNDQRKLPEQPMQQYGKQQQNGFEDQQQEQRPSKRNMPQSGRSTVNEEQQIEDGLYEQGKRDKKIKGSNGTNEGQIRQNEKEHQNFKKLKNKDFFTENSETENEQSDFAETRKPIGKPVKNQIQNNGEQKTLQKSRQTQSSALLVKQGRNLEDGIDDDQQYQNKQVNMAQKQQVKVQQDNDIPNIYAQQQQTKSILKQNKSQENLLKNNEQNNTQDQRISHKNQQQQPQVQQIRRNKEEQDQQNSENVYNLQNQKPRNTKRNNEDYDVRNQNQRENYDLDDVPNNQIKDDDELENDQQAQHQQNRSQQSDEQDNYHRNQDRQNRIQQNGHENRNPNIKNKVTLQQTPQQKNFNDQLSAQFTFNEEEEDTIIEQDQGKHQHNGDEMQKRGQIQQIRNHPANQLKANQGQQQQPQNNIRGQNTNGVKKQQMKSSNLGQQQNQNIQNQDDEEEDTEVDELRQMPQINQKVNKQQPIQTKNSQIINKQAIPNKPIQQKKIEQTYQNEEEQLQDQQDDVNDNDDFNRVDEALDLAQNPNLQNQLSKPIHRAPNGALQQNANSNVTQQQHKDVNAQQKQIPKQIVPNKRKEEVMNNQNVFHEISIEQNEVSDFTQGHPALINQPQNHQIQQQQLMHGNNNNNTNTNKHNNNFIPQQPQGFTSPPPSNYQNYQQNVQNLNFQSPPQYPQQMQQQMNPYLGSPMNQMDQSPYNMNNNIQFRQYNVQQQPQNGYYNNYNQHPQYQQAILSPIQKNIQGQMYQDQGGFDAYYQNSMPQQQYQPYPQNPQMQYNTNPQMMNQNINNQTLNSSFLTNQPVNTSINGSLINRSFTPRRRIFEETNNRNQPFLPQTQLDFRGNEQQYTTPLKGGTTTPLRQRNNEQQQRLNIAYPSRSISPNGNNNFHNRGNEFAPQQLPINSQSLQFAPNQINQRGIFNNQPPFVNQQQNYNTFQQPQNFGVKQQQQQPLTQQLPFQNQNKFNTLPPNYNSNPSYIPNTQQDPYLQSNIVPNHHSNILSGNPAERMNNTPRGGAVASPMEQNYNTNPVRNNVSPLQKQQETPSPNFAPSSDRGQAIRNIQPIVNTNRDLSPTQIKSPNNNFNFKNMNIPLFEKIKQQQQEQFKQMGFENNSNKSSNTFNQSTSFAPTVPSTQPTTTTTTASVHTTNNGNIKGSESLSNQVAQPMSKAASSNQQPYYIIDKIQSSGEKDDLYNSNEQLNSVGIKVPKEESSQQNINGIMFSLNANYKEAQPQVNNNILQLFSLLDVKKQGWISQSSLDYSKLPTHMQLRIDLNKILEDAFKQANNVDFDLFYKITTSKFPQVVQYCSNIFNTNSTVQSSIPQQQMRPPSFGLPKDQVIFQ